ncbi:MAG: Gfo/Idh/MocA family oxidoreductase [Verrucomicrobiota bacterium]
MKIGIIGCGNISSAYFKGGQQASNLEVKACADLFPEAAKRQADEYGRLACSVDELLADSEIELVVNLTIPQAHVAVGIQCLDAGKHVYSEKPFGVDLEEGKRLRDHAEVKGLRLGCAPDTFLFGNAQTARKLLDDGWIGRPFAGVVSMMCAGHETWHPNPGFYYDEGGGPMMDMGPYYIHMLINLLGPIRSVTGKTTRAFDERLATSENAFGQILPVKTETHLTGVLEFESGALVTTIMSFDVKNSECGNFQIFGTDGTLHVGDPNNFPRPIRVRRKEDEEVREIPQTHAKNARMIGVMDMVQAIKDGRPHRVNADIALHTLEAMLAFEASSKSGSAIKLETTCKKPAALPAGLPEWHVD